jgi:AcrR family transcriptional regulator
MQEIHDQQRARREEQQREQAEKREAARAQQRAKQEERRREAEERPHERHKQWQLALEVRIGAMHDRLHGQAPARGAARELLIAEATERFQERGFADVSMQEIADAVGVTKAAMYYHFQSKEALFEVVVERTVNAFWSGISVYARADGPLRDVLRGIIAYVKGSLEGISLRLMEDFQRHCSPEAHQRILSEHPTPEHELEELFARAMAAGEMRPLNAAAVADLFLVMVFSLGGKGHTHRAAQPGGDEVLLDVFLHGIAPAAPA